VVLSLVGNAKIIRLKIYPQGEQFYTDALSVFWEQVSSGTLVSMHNQLAWKVTMSSWFISPWEVARVSLEAQRLIALQFFPFAPRKEQPHQEHQEEASGNRKAVVPGLGSSADLPTPPRARETVRARTVAARNVTDVIRKATGIRKTKSSERKRKNNKQRG
jgi:hypothetical protein